MLNIYPYLKTVSFSAVIALAMVAIPAQGAKIEVTSGATRTPIVELYTSEGCSSCPRADEWVSQLGDTLNSEFHAVPLAFHVDYWNYLGWEDPFSKKAFTERQRLLGAMNKQRSIYTPEFLVSGSETRGTHAVIKAIQHANLQPALVNINLGLDSAEPNQVDAGIEISGQTENAELYLAVYENNISRSIEGGENEGRTLHHDFVVRHWQKVALLKSAPYSGRHVVTLGDDWQTENLGVAAVVIHRDSGQTLQAVSTDLTGLFVEG